MVEFQSTLSVRRATDIRQEMDSTSTFQSTLSVRRATILTQLQTQIREFQSTLSVRRATCGDITQDGSVRISIHALRKESDKLHFRGRAGRFLFQSTLSVRRATLSSGGDILEKGVFQSTLSVRRATVQLDIFVHFLRRKPAAWL